MKPETIEQFYRRHDIDSRIVTINNASIVYSFYRKDYYELTCLDRKESIKVLIFT